MPCTCRSIHHFIQTFRLRDTRGCFNGLAPLLSNRKPTPTNSDRENHQLLEEPQLSGMGVSSNNFTSDFFQKLAEPKKNNLPVCLKSLKSCLVFIRFLGFRLRNFFFQQTCLEQGTNYLEQPPKQFTSLRVFQVKLQVFFV